LKFKISEKEINELRKKHHGELSLRKADLTETNLNKVDLSKADLSGADLRKADLHKANLCGANLSGAVYDKETIWPDGFDPQAAGAIPVK
jgi:uncharacterized protein YjbI with pentapeptide repeats